MHPLLYVTIMTANTLPLARCIMTSSNGNIFRVTGPLCGEFTGHRGIHRSSVNSPLKGQWRGALMFPTICALNKRLSKQSWGWWFETPSRSLWRHCKGIDISSYSIHPGHNNHIRKRRPYLILQLLKLFRKRSGGRNPKLSFWLTGSLSYRDNTLWPQSMS